MGKSDFEVNTMMGHEWGMGQDIASLLVESFPKLSEAFTPQSVFSLVTIG